MFVAIEEDEEALLSDVGTSLQQEAQLYHLKKHIASSQTLTFDETCKLSKQVGLSRGFIISWLSKQRKYAEMLAQEESQSEHVIKWKGLWIQNFV